MLTCLLLSGCEPSAQVAQLVEHPLGKGEVSGSIPLLGSRQLNSWQNT